MQDVLEHNAKGHSDDSFAIHFVPVIQALIADNIELRNRLLGVCEKFTEEELDTFGVTSFAVCHTAHWEEQKASLRRLFEASSSGSSPSSKKKRKQPVSFAKPVDMDVKSLLVTMAQCKSKEAQLALIHQHVMSLEGSGSVSNGKKKVGATSDEEAASTDDEDEENAEGAPVPDDEEQHFYKHMKQKLHPRPRGRAPKGKSWDATNGHWI